LFSRRKGKKIPNPQNTPQNPNKLKYGDQKRHQRTGIEKLHVSTKNINVSGSKIIGEIEKILK